eukprot:scaffold194278_cov19-Tisochrysis_lutea.AAC.1
MSVSSESCSLWGCPQHFCISPGACVAHHLPEKEKKITPAVKTLHTLTGLVLSDSVDQACGCQSSYMAFLCVARQN